MSSNLTSSTFDFLTQLAQNNNRDWFNEHKDLYIDSQQNVLDFVTELLEDMEDMNEEFAKIDPKKTLFRIYRDTRFSKDKSPYKTNFGASINGMGKKDGKAGYYLHIAPNACFLAAGVYMCDSKKLKTIRTEISQNASEFLEIVDHKAFKKFTFTGEKLSRVPQGFEKEDPMAEFLKLKHFAVTTPIKDADLMSAKAIEKCVSTFRTMQPLVDFLNRIEI